MSEMILQFTAQKKFSMGKSNLDSFITGRDNNLNLIRLLAISMVIYSHSFILSGNLEPTPPFIDGGYGPIGLNVFFILSGFLITQSYLRTPNPARFIWSRALRIFPALFCVVTLSAFVLGPLVTTLPLGTYFSSPQTYFSFLTFTLFIVKYNLPGVFTHNAYGTAVNGSLWMLKYMVVFYLFVLFLGMARVLEKKRSMLILFLLSLVLHHLNVGKGLFVFTISIEQTLRLFTYFGLGMVAYLYRDSLAINIYYFIFCVLVLVIASVKHGLNESLFAFVLTYIVLYLGFNKRINLPWFSKTEDISYGVFIYSFPVQQTIIYLYGGKMNPWINFSTSLVISLALGALSWYVCEKHFLKFKDSRLLRLGRLGDA